MVPTLLRGILKNRIDYSELRNQVMADVRFEVGQIDRLFTEYSQLFDLSPESSPDPVQITALGSVLHSFYNGVESIFVAISKRIDGKRPSGENWHSDLLLFMTQPTDKREFVITPQTASILKDYLRFRHFYRHSYVFFLDWQQLKKLALPAHKVWSQTKADLEAFLADLASRQTPSTV